MPDDRAQNLVLIAAVAIGGFLVVRALWSATPVQAATQSLTPAVPQEPGLVIRGRNYSALIPLPDIGALFGSLRDSAAGAIAVQPGQRIQFLEPGPTDGEPRMGTA
jgi:hypothetical protein